LLTGVLPALTHDANGWAVLLWLQWTMFFKDPSGNSLEFKAMTNPDNLFAKYFVSS